MNKKIGVLIFLVLLCIVSLGPVFLFAQDQQLINVPLDSAEILRVDSDLDRVVVGDPDVVRVSAINTREIIIFGKKSGQSSLHVWTNKGVRRFWLKVEKIAPHEVGDDRRDILREIGKVDEEGMELRVFTPRYRDISEFEQYIDELLAEDGEVLLTDDSIGKIFVVGTTEVLDKIDILLDRLDVPDEETSYTRRVDLEHRSVGELINNVEKMLSEEGTTFIDRETNSIMVIDNVSKVGEVETYLKSIDVPTTRQVRIEARFVEMTDEAEREMGISWDYSGQINNQEAQARLLPEVDANAQGLGLELLKGASNLGARLRMMESEGLLNYISSPSVTTRSGTTAELEILNEISYIAGEETFYDEDGRPIRSEPDIQKTEDGIELSVSPVISQTDIIQMNIGAKLSIVNLVTEQFKGEVVRTPEVDRRQVNLDVSLKDGQTLILGGLNREQSADQNEKVPLLGRIPLIGKLFFSQDLKSQENTNITIFLTANIVELTEDGYEISTEPEEVLSSDTLPVTAGDTRDIKP